jgi:hypothetical protein
MLLHTMQSIRKDLGTIRFWNTVGKVVQVFTQLDCRNQIVVLRELHGDYLLVNLLMTLLLYQ